MSASNKQVNSTVYMSVRSERMSSMRMKNSKFKYSFSTDSKIDSFSVIQQMKTEFLKESRVVKASKVSLPKKDKNTKKSSSVLK